MPYDNAGSCILYADCRSGRVDNFGIKGRDKMSSFAKKLKRKEQVERNKKVVKKTVSLIKVERAAKHIFNLNKSRIDEFSHCRVLPTIAYILHNSFKWGATRLAEMSNKLIKFVDDYFMAGIRDGHVYLTDEWLREGLEIECKYKFPEYKRLPKPVDAEKKLSWVAMYAGNQSIFVLECLETICMWILHTDYGFGATRLKRFGEQMRKIKPLDMPIKMLYHMMDDVEQAKGKCKEKLVFTELRQSLKKLDIQNNNFEGGLLMIEA